MRELTNNLKSKADRLSSLIPREKEKIDQRKARLSQTEKRLKTDIQKKEYALADLQKEMDDLLPSWVRGLLKVEDMMQIFPMVLMLMTAYVVSSAHALTGHHWRAMESMDLTDEERRDPAFSSVWTLHPGVVSESGRLWALF